MYLLCEENRMIAVAVSRKSETMLNGIYMYTIDITITNYHV